MDTVTPVHSSRAKGLIKSVFGWLGLRVHRVPRSACGARGARRYFGTGERKPLEDNTRELNNAFYADQEALEEYLDEYRFHLLRTIARRVKESGAVLDGKDLIDVGCGTGHLLAEIGKFNSPRAIFGCDFSEAAVKCSAQRFSDGQFFVHDIYQPLPRRYDVLLCTEVLEHLERPHVALRRLVDAAAPGGVVIITVPNGRTDNLIQHINFWSPESWKAFIERECPECQATCDTLGDGHENNIAVIRCPVS